MEQDIENFNPNQKSKKKENKKGGLLGKKIKRDDDEFDAPEDKLSKSIGKLNVNDESLNESISEYESVTEEEEIYESDDNSDQYQETEIKEKPKKTTDTVKVWNEKVEKVNKDEDLVFDNSAYQMLHRSTVDWPCYSVDWILPEYFIPQPVKNFYSPLTTRLYKDEFPYTAYFVAGAQTSEKHGVLYYMKWFNMHRTLYDEDPDKEGDSESEGGDPLMEHAAITSRGNVNRVKVMKNSYIAAYWSDLKSIELVDLRKNIEEMENRWSDETHDKKKSKKKKTEERNPHVKSFKKKDEGFALDWSNFLPGVFGAGGYDNEIEIFIPVDEMCSDYTGGTNNSYKYRTNFKAHKGGVEDIVWSPVDPHILVSGGNDKAIRIWDLRLNNNSEVVVALEKAHQSDVNCLAWKESSGVQMIASGSDDSTVKIWDPRMMSNSNSVIANIQYHNEPITSLSWDPNSPCQLAVTSEDNRLSIWDFSVEPDEVKTKDTTTSKEIPDQLVFLHQGQENLKDVKYHPYFEDMLLSTAENGLNMFKPNFNEDEDEEDDEEFTFNPK